MKVQVSFTTKTIAILLAMVLTVTIVISTVLIKESEAQVVMQQRESRFRDIVDQTGTENVALLENIAREAHEKRRDRESERKAREEEEEKEEVREGEEEVQLNKVDQLEGESRSGSVIC